jgi:hypothetical protein
MKKLIRTVSFLWFPKEGPAANRPKEILSCYISSFTVLGFIIAVIEPKNLSFESAVGHVILGGKQWRRAPFKNLQGILFFGHFELST